MIIDEKLVISKKKKKDLMVELKQKGFKAIPKVAEAAKAGENAPLAEDEEETEEEDAELPSTSYDYLLGVRMSHLCYKLMLTWELCPDAFVVFNSRTSGKVATSDRGHGDGGGRSYQIIQRRYLEERPRRILGRMAIPVGRRGPTHEKGF